eukprot:365179-Chlamydomonas_euryale.AAC.5
MRTVKDEEDAASEEGRGGSWGGGDQGRGWGGVELEYHELLSVKEASRSAQRHFHALLWHAACVTCQPSRHVNRYACCMTMGVTLHSRAPQLTSS